MKAEDTVEYNSLRWVKKELDLILHEAQTSLSAYIEDTNEADRLRECIEHLHMVQGTLQMVELYGAAQLAEEMELLASALLNGSVEKKDDTYDVLMRSMLQLPDYLESLQAGNKDVPMVLLPLLNDLRASRNASLLSENVLFFPDIEVAEADAGAAKIEAGKLLAQAKKLRPHFQIGLLGWFKGEKVGASLKRIQAVLTELEKFSAQSTKRLWSISAALLDGLIHDAADSNVSVKMLLGQVDRSIKQLIDEGEDHFAKSVSPELLKNLLYYVARINQDLPRVTQVKEAYRLKELLPGDAELEEARSGLGGLNTELLRTVSQGIREDLLEVKDALEIYVHSESRDVERISSLPDLLNKIADTLAMLGLGAAREDVLTQRGKIEQLAKGTLEASDDKIMDIASVLLGVEAQLNSFIANRSSKEGVKGKRRVGDLLSEMPDGEYQEVLAAVIREALQDFNDARQAVLGYLENNKEVDLLEVVLQRLDEVKGAMFMLPIQHLEPQINALKDYINKVLLGAQQVPDAKSQDDLADVVTSIEYYLEAVLEGRPDLEYSLAAGEKAANRLREVAKKFADVAPASKAPVAKGSKDTSKAAVDQSVTKAAETKPANETGAKKTAEAAIAPAKKQDFEILGDDVDEEILEIFIEEALEVLATLNEQIPVWIRDLGNDEALITIRRSFHTLKGSGRLIGAQLIGEFAWNFENMLNRVIDKSRPADQDVFDLLEESLGVLPQLIEQLKGNREPITNVYDLIDRAEALSKWRKNASQKSDAESPGINPLEKKEPEIEQPVAIEEPDIVDSLESDDGSIEISLDEAADDGSIPEIDFTEAGLDEDLDFEVAGESIDLAEDDINLDDEFDIDLTQDLEALQLAISPGDEIDEGLLEDEFNITESLDVSSDFDLSAMDQDEDQEASSFEQESTLQIHADPVLFEIFKNESESHLNQIQSMIRRHQNGDPLIAGHDLIRALHTLYGSARTAEVDEIAGLCGEMEKYVRRCQEAQVLEIPEEGVKLIDEVCGSVAVMLELLADPKKRLNANVTLLDQIRNATQSISDEDVVVSKASATSKKQPAKSASPSPAKKETLVSYSDVDDELVDIFLEEAEELLDGCENSLQRWNSNNADAESVKDLQRQLHTLKGGARMADLSPIGDLTHSLESLVITVNDGHLDFSRDMFHVLHGAMDRLSDMLAKVKVREPIATADQLIDIIEALRRGETVDVKKPDEPDSEAEKSESSKQQEQLADITFEEEPDEDILDLQEELSVEFNDGALSIVDDEDAVENFIIEDDSADNGEFIIEEEPEQVSVTTESEEDQSDDRVLLSRKDAAEPQEDLATKNTTAHEQVRVRSDLLNELVNHAGEVSVYHARMGQQVSRFAFNLSEMDQTVTRLRDQLRKLTNETEAQILSRYEKETDQYDEHFDPLEMDRFSTMQTISRGLQETVGDIESIKDILYEGVRDSETLLLQESRVSSDLQEGLMRTRMVHFGGLGSRLRRIVRQTARELDNDVELDIHGETSEVDRTVLDRIVAPLEHMLRNAVSHGMESPDKRKAAGKPEIGKIIISVDRSGGDVVIKVKDDGRGIDVDAVRKRAIERGLLDKDSKVGDHDVLQFIMQPGFSTAEKVTQISGRGVGMDVVDSEIKQLGGVLEIDTAKGKGTSFTIRLPLTLAINQALLVSANEEIYAVPLNSIEGVVRLSGPELQMFYNSEDSAYQFAGSTYDLKNLGYLLSGVQQDYARNAQLYPVLLARIGEQRVAIHVDELLGRREIVVKPVGPQINTVRGVSGATILGDGRVVLILELHTLVFGGSLFHIIEQETEVDQPVVTKVAEKHREPLIMVVDDSITIRKVTERMLARHGMQVMTAKDGIDAVSKLQDIIPDVMLLDIEMPRMDGYEVATHVRNDERLKDLPIIMITSRTGAKHRDKAMEIGVNKYLGKPYQEDDLVQNINELLG